MCCFESFFVVRSETAEIVPDGINYKLYIVSSCVHGTCAWQDVAEAAHVAVDAALQSLPDFPAADQLPKPIRLDKAGVFVYQDHAWLPAVWKV